MLLIILLIITNFILFRLNSESKIIESEYQRPITDVFETIEITPIGENYHSLSQLLISTFAVVSSYLSFERFRVQAQPLLANAIVQH